MRGGAVDPAAPPDPPAPPPAPPEPVAVVVVLADVVPVGVASDEPQAASAAAETSVTSDPNRMVRSMGVSARARGPAGAPAHRT
jgi:hypothetical protein